MNKTFEQNYLVIKKCFPGEFSKRHALGAFLCMVNDTENKNVISQERIMECKRILKRKVNLSAAFRDYLKLPVVIKMAISDDPEKYLEGIVKTYNNIRSTYFTGSGQKFITALAIHDNCKDEEIDKYCSVMYELYGRMKEEHPLLTGQEDMMFAALLAIDSEEHDSVVEEMENCYVLLRDRFKGRMNPIQNVSHILALTNEDSVKKTAKFISLYEALKDNNSRAGVGPQLILLSVLSILDINVDTSVKEILDTDEYLRQIKGFGKLGIDVRIRRMISVALTAAAHLTGNGDEKNGVKTSLLRTVLSSAMIGGMIISKSARGMSGHR